MRELLEYFNYNESLDDNTKFTYIVNFISFSFVGFFLMYYILFIENPVVIISTSISFFLFFTVFFLLKFNKNTMGKFLLLIAFFLQESLLIFYLFPKEANFNYFLYIVTPITFFIFNLENKQENFYIIFTNTVLVLIFLLSEVIPQNNPVVLLTKSQTHLFSLLSALFTMGSIIIVFYHYASSINYKTKELLRLSETDGLTELFNRRTLFKVGDELTCYNSRKVKDFTFIIMDIDYFKVINDTWGHQVGDGVLKSFTDLIRGNIRKGDLFFRYGGEEFALILEDTIYNEGENIAENLRKLVSSTTFNINNIKINITISLGVSYFKDTKESFDEIVTAADTALYKAKNFGRNRVVVNSN